MIKGNKSTVCITGASKGLGYALVQTFLKESNFQIAAITRNGEELRKQLESEEERERVHIIEANIGVDSGRREVRDHINTMPELRILIHNAGKLIFKPFLEITEKELKDIYNVNFFAPFHLTQQLMPLMSRAHIIHISSIGGVDGSLKFGGLSAYSTSKAALNCLTEMLSEEFKETENSFNCLALGSVATEMFAAAFPGASASATPEIMAKYIFHFALQAPEVMRGKIISLSRSNP